MHAMQSNVMQPRQLHPSCVCRCVSCFTWLSGCRLSGHCHLKSEGHPSTYCIALLANFICCVPTTALLTTTRQTSRVCTHFLTNTSQNLEILLYLNFTNIIISTMCRSSSEYVNKWITSFTRVGASRQQAAHSNIPRARVLFFTSKSKYEWIY